MKKTLTTLGLISFFFSSCSFIQMQYMGFRSPTPIEREKVFANSGALNIPVGRNYQLCPDYFYDFILIRDPSPKRWIRLFDAKGNRINYHGENFKESCPGGIEDFIHVFSKGTDYTMFKESETLQKESSNWCSTEGNRYSSLSLPEADLNIVISWADFMSIKRQKKTIHRLKKEIEKRPDLNIEVYYVNIDLIKGNPNEYYERIASQKIISARKQTD
jgi:hypothetical protein